MANKSPKPYVHQDWPSWRYGPDEGDEAIFDGPDDVPEGWVDSPAHRGMTDKEIEAHEVERLTPPLTGTAKVKADATAKAVEKAEKKAEKKGKGSEKKPTLEILDISREEAESFLAENEVPFKKKASDDAVAALVTGVLDDAEDEDDNSGGDS